MKIALIAAPWLPVPPRAYGGSEGVIDCLATGFVEAGHDVLLVTTGDSTCEVPKYEQLLAADTRVATGVGTQQMFR